MKRIKGTTIHQNNTKRISQIQKRTFTEGRNWLEYNNRKREVENFTAWDDIDFLDALTLQTMKKNNTKEIYSKDTDFDRTK
jgi:predicted nucleic acid-binding protein